MNEWSEKYGKYGVLEAKLLPLGDSAVTVQFGETICRQTHDRVRQLAEHLEGHRFAGMIEYVPAFLSVTVYFDPFEALAGLGDGADPSAPIRLPWSPGGSAISWRSWRTRLSARRA